MAWFFGGGGNSGGGSQAPPQDPSSGAGQTAGAQTGDQTLTKAEKKAMEAYRFDSSALERAAQAARTLETSSKTRIRNELLGHFIITSAYFNRTCQGRAGPVQDAGEHSSTGVHGQGEGVRVGD